MGAYPINLELKDVVCVVVGGGLVAERKVLRLLLAGASVRVIAPQVTPNIGELAVRGRLLLVARALAPGDIRSLRPRLVFAATDSAEVNARAAAEAHAIGALVNIASLGDGAATGAADATLSGTSGASAAEPTAAALSDFTVPSSVEHGDFLVTVATGGASPAFTRRIRHELERLYPESFGEFLPILNRLRAEVIGESAPVAAGGEEPTTNTHKSENGNMSARERERLWRAVLTDDIIALVRAGELETAEARIIDGINSYRAKS